MNLAGLAATAALALSAQTPPSFGVRVEIVHIDVFVSRGNEPIGDLSSADFRVYDNGVLQKAEVLSDKAAPLHAILLLDTSSSVAGKTFEHLKAAGQALLEGLGEDDRVTLLSFAYDIKMTEGPAAPAPAASAALARATAKGATALYDAVYAALKVADSRHGRPVIVIFSDGLDRLSFLSSEKVLRVARESEATAYAVFLAKSPSDPEARPPRVPEFLRDVAKETGGEAWKAVAPEELRERFLKILFRVKDRYVLRFEPKGVTRPGWHELKVRLKGRRANIRARPGYYVPPDPED